MAGLGWMAVTLAVFLSTRNSLAAVKEKKLESALNEILKRFRPRYAEGENQWKYPMFSLAASIPYNERWDSYEVNRVPDRSDQVRNTIQNCDVYTGTRVVAATVLNWPDVLTQCPTARVPWPEVLQQCPAGVLTWADIQNTNNNKCTQAVLRRKSDHAEYRTLQQFNTLPTNNNEDDLLLFYTYGSPCHDRCASETDPLSILKLINPIKRWKNYAFVFSKPFKPSDGTPVSPEVQEQALLRLARYEGPLGPIGLENIFRCERKNQLTKCSSCSADGNVAPGCISDATQAGTDENLPSTSYIQPQQGRGSFRGGNTGGARGGLGGMDRQGGGNFRGGNPGGARGGLGGMDRQGGGSFRGGNPGGARGGLGGMDRQGGGNFRGGNPGGARGGLGGMDRQGGGSFRGGNPGGARGGLGGMDRQGGRSFRGGNPGGARGGFGGMDRQGGGSFRGGNPGGARGGFGGMDRQGGGSFRGGNPGGARGGLGGMDRQGGRSFRGGNP
ncbi:uncharacterized protein [Trachinotus anak]|uniref:uncharacterized protein n=1 Tax=Trachinotus anak TaxID=443729 RepID=UPI0039F1F6D1